MKFSIITPSFRNSEWLKLCIASVADQQVPLEHIVQDAGSDDGTLDWLPRDPRVKAFVEKDRGMYDAINRGLRRASGDILAYLNCDEQYLPGALAAVGEYFDAHPQVEVAFADAVVVDPAGRYICHRQASLPGKLHSSVSGNLSVLTCATFFRQSVIKDRKIFFDPACKAVGDAIWILHLLERDVRMGLLLRFTSAFTETGANLCLHPSVQRERHDLLTRAPRWARWGRYFVVLQYRLRRLMAGHYHPKPMTYSIYTTGSPQARVQFHVASPVSRWKRSQPV